ncbi:MAG TPA: choice-of-anchor B family protein, partial [Chitinophagales bacterium]|nr:choice-of-anchor B family protein [Chitinophagales bacterium]
MFKLLTCWTVVLLSIAALPVFGQNQNFVFRDKLAYPVALSNLWGYVDSDGNEYGLVGTYNRLSIVDVNNPDSLVQLFEVPHPGSTWCEVKTWNHYAYVVNETGGGMIIVDLSDLPNGITQTTFTGYDLKTAHTLWIDENGILYLFGYDTNAGLEANEKGAMVLDLNADPTNPVLLGTHNDRYFHDGFVRGDTLWGSAIYDGQLVVMDVTDKSNFETMALQTTPLAFTHNAWPTSDNQFIFTTDEKSNSHLTAYDVSDLGNIQELDRVQSNPGSNAVIHNAHLVDNDFAAASYYNDGVITVDVSQPDNMIIVGSYDTSPLGGNGFTGAWGVYP